MAFDPVQFFLAHPFVIIFYMAVASFVYLNRKRMQIYFKIVAVYRTNWGIGLMGRISSRYREPVKLLGYIGIGVGFIGMFGIILILLVSVYNLFAVPDAPPAITPILPGVHVPGVPESLFVPLIQGVIAILVIAVIHEFSHGVVARAHDVKIKATGPVIFGPFFAAFVEPDEKQMKKKDDVVNYSIIAAGPFSNILTFIFLFFLLSFVLTPGFNTIFPSQGIVFSNVDPDTPADLAGIPVNEPITALNGEPLTSASDFTTVFTTVRPGENISLTSAQQTYTMITGTHPNDRTRAYMGVQLRNYVPASESAVYRSSFWVLKLLSLIAILSLGIGLANLLPIGPIDGGKMFHIATTRIQGEKHGTKTLWRLSLALLIIILLLFTPIFRETAKLIVN